MANHSLQHMPTQSNLLNHSLKKANPKDETSEEKYLKTTISTVSPPRLSGQSPCVMGCAVRQPGAYCTNDTRRSCS